MRVLSSKQTFFWKFVFPACWALVYGPPAVAGLLGRSDERFMFLFLVVGGSLLAFLFGGRLKKVELGERVLRVSNYLRTTSVPLTRVAEVKRVGLGRWQNIRIRFTEDTPFGPSIVFLPPAAFIPFAITHPLVGELQAVVARANADLHS